MTATALSLFHELDATIMILVWNLGVAVMFVGLGGVLSGKLVARNAAGSTLLEQ
jgi:hypothetical protein